MHKIIISTIKGGGGFWGAVTHRSTTSKSDQKASTLCSVCGLD